MVTLAVALVMVMAQSDALRIVVIEGEDAVNIVQQKSAVAPVIEVRDRNNQPVAGAIVRFAINQGRGTFAGARTLSVTTNAAGRAVATGLTPTGGGALQIGASATFQGQTVVATITQTNVMTAAEAAAAGGASGSSASGGASTGAAGGGGSGGISGTTLGIVGGAVAGGAVAATTALGGGENTTQAASIYRGSFSMQSVYNSDTFTNGAVTGFCHNQVVTITGTVAVTLNESGSGGIEMEWTQDTAPSGQCPGHAPHFTSRSDVGSATGITLENAYSSNYDAPSGTVRQTNAHRFSGALNGGVVNGTVTIWQELTLVAPAGPNITQTGGFPAASSTVTLTRQ